MEFGYHNASLATSVRLAVCQDADLPPEFVGVRERFWAKVLIGDPAQCWPWTAARGGTADRDGTAYGSFRVASRSWFAHRCAWILTYGPIPDGLDILHSCDFKPCCNPTHLSAGTHTKNIRDASIRGRLKVPHPRARTKLTTEAVEEIVAYINTNGRGSITAMARKHGVSQPYISMLMQGKRRQYDAPLASPVAVEKAS